MSTATERASEHPYGWVVVAVATVSLALGFGAGVVVSVLMKPMEEEFGWFRADISMAYTTYSIGAALGGLFWGALSDRIGAKPVALIGTSRLMLMVGAKDGQLKQWTVTDPQGYDTTVAVYNLDPQKKVDPGLFKIDFTNYSLPPG